MKCFQKQQQQNWKLNYPSSNTGNWVYPFVTCWNQCQAKNLSWKWLETSLRCYCICMEMWKSDSWDFIRHCFAVCVLFFYLNKITEIWYVCKISSSRYGKALKAKITTNSNKTVEKLNTIGILLAVLHKFYSRALIVIISLVVHSDIVLEYCHSCICQLVKYW